MMKTPDTGHASTEPRAKQRGRFSTCLFLESTVSAIVVVVIDVTSEQPLQMRFVDGNHVVQQFATATSYQPFRDTILPRTASRGPHHPDTHGANGDRNFGAVLCVVIEEQKLDGGLVRKGLTQLLHNPCTR